MQKVEKRVKKAFLRCLAVFLAVAVSVTMTPLKGNSVYGETEAVSSLTTESPEILVSGTAVIGSEIYSTDNVGLEKAYTRQQLKAMDGGENILYSQIKSKEPYTKQLTRATGVYVASLFEGTAFDMSEDKAAFIATDDWKVTFDPAGQYNNGKLDTTGLNVERYVFPNLLSGSEEGKTAVRPMIAWSLETSEKEDPKTTAKEGATCTLTVGQLNFEDMNNPLFNKKMQKVIGGDELTETALTVDGSEYTRGDVLLMDRADRSYSYSTSNGDATDYVRGVPMSVLLDGYDDSSTVSFATADGYDVAASGKTVKELIEENYILAYEKGTGTSDLKGIYSTAKKDSSKYGFFTLYGDNDKPAKMVNSIKVTAAEGIDFSTSPYKHITNGGITDADGPYNIDGITGATLTVEGPGVKNSVPLSVRDLESKNNGAFRGNYSDVRDDKDTERTYEGIDLYYILNNMSSGDNGIILTDTARKVLIKNRNRNTIATFTLDQVKELHDAGKPVLVAYGTSYTDGTNIKPFVFDGAAGGDKDLGNYDGCLKLVYDKSKITGDLNADYTEFANMAYIYVAEESTPGYKHDKEPYNTAENSKYVLTVTGEKIGREVNYTVEQLENMVEYDESGAPVAGGIGHRDEYSLANSSYWYVNEYEGVKLWDILMKSGLDETSGTDDTTKVKFSATDGYTAFDEFTLKQVADPDSFGYYEKNAADNNDGKYESVPEDLKDTGYPVLIAYGVNGYPYVISKNLDGYLSGLQNDGGPLRIISGKMNYNHANGSNQAKLLDKILVGEDKYHYSTHKYHDNSVYNDLAGSKLDVRVYNGSGDEAALISDKSYTVGDIEELIYGGSLTKSELAEAKVKGFYQLKKNGSYYNDLYEGINLSYFLTDIVGLPGQKGTVTFSDGSENITLTLDQVLKLKDGYNKETELGGLTPVLAYAKNGAPMVADKNAAGYEKEVTLKSGDDPVTVKNDGGPLCMLMPFSSETADDAASMKSITSITVNIAPDNYAHVKAPYDAYKDNTVEVSGEGTRITGKKTFTVSELEEKQNLAVTDDYSIMKDGAAEASQLRYRGISLYDFLKSTAVGLKNNADRVIIKCADGTESEFTLSEVRASYVNSVTGKDDLKMILAYGSAPVTNEDREDGKPLVAEKDSEGYDADYQNSGGPIKLVVGQKDSTTANSKQIIKYVTGIEVTASEMDSWNHSSSEVFKEYLTDTVKLKVIDENDNALFERDYTVEELEAMDSIIERADITSTSTDTCEGLNFWKFVEQETAGVQGMDQLITVNVSAKDGFTKDFLSIFGKDQLENGIKDGSRRVPILLAYGINGYPLASGGKSNPNGPGYDSTVGNNGGPIRIMTHGNQGACLQETNKIVIKVKAENPEFNTDEADGTTLPVAGVRSVKFDKDGGMWVGTYGGGAAYKAKGSDTYKIYNKASEPALETTFVSAIATDADGGVWMSQNASYTDPSANKGAVYLKDGRLTSYRAADNPETIPDDYVQDIKIDDQGNVWFASFGGLTKYDPQAGTWKTWDKNDGFPAMSVTRIEFDGNGGIWCGFYPDGEGTETDPFRGGFAHIDKDGRITSYPQEAGFDENYNGGVSKLADVWIRDIAVDKDGAAWIIASGAYADIENTGGTLWYVRNTGAEPVKYTGDQLFGKALDGAENAEIRMVEADGNGGMYFGTSADGIFYVKNAKISSEGSLDITAEYSTETGAWQKDTMNNVYSLDIYNNTVYAGSSGGLAWLEISSGGSESEKPGIGDADKDTCDISFTGEGLKKDAYFTVKGLKNAEGIKVQTLIYAWQNSSGATGTSEVEGAYVENILKDVIGLKSNAAKITFTASDGYKKTFDVAEMSAADLAGLKPMLAWKEDGVKINLKLVLGQKTEGESNKSKWVSDIVSVTVTAEGEEKPEEPDKPDTPSDEKGTVGDATADSYDLAITGDGVENNGYFSIKGLKNAEGVEKRNEDYSWLDGKGDAGVSAFEGAYVENLLENVVGLEDDASTVTIIADDGTEQTAELSRNSASYGTVYKVAEMFRQDIDGNKPMLAWKENDTKINLRFVVGKSSENDANKEKWIDNVVQIKVDAASENPDKPDEPDNPDPDKPDSPDSTADDNPAASDTDKNNPDSSSRTGDEMPIGILAVILAAAAAGTIGVIRTRKKRI